MTLDALWLDSIIGSFRQATIDDAEQRAYTIRSDESGQFICVSDFIRHVSNCAPKIAQSRMSRLPKYIKETMKRRVCITDKKNKNGDKRGLNQPCITASLCICLSIGLCFCPKRDAFFHFFSKHHTHFLKFITREHQDFHILYTSLCDAKRHIVKCQQFASFLETNNNHPIIFDTHTLKDNAMIFGKKGDLKKTHPLSPLLPLESTTQTKPSVYSPISSSSFIFPSSLG